MSVESTYYLADWEPLHRLWAKGGANALGDALDDEVEWLTWVEEWTGGEPEVSVPTSMAQTAEMAEAWLACRSIVGESLYAQVEATLVPLGIGSDCHNEWPTVQELAREDENEDGWVLAALSLPSVHSLLAKAADLEIDAIKANLEARGDDENAQLCLEMIPPTVRWVRFFLGEAVKKTRGALVLCA